MTKPGDATLADAARRLADCTAGNIVIELAEKIRRGNTAGATITLHRVITAAYIAGARFVRDGEST